MIERQQINQLFYEMIGKDLSMELSTLYADASSDAVLTFINDCVEYVKDYCMVNFAWNSDYYEEQFKSHFQEEMFKKAIVSQLEYWLDNGKLHLESGYDVEKGTFADVKDIEKRTLAPQCYMKLNICGLANLRRY